MAVARMFIALALLGTPVPVLAQHEGHGGAEAQAVPRGANPYERGLYLLHNFEYEDAIESFQANPSGALIVDAVAGGRFYPNSSTTKLTAAIAYVKAAGLESLTTSAPLPVNIVDASSIPSAYRGYVAVALQRCLIRLDGNAFNASRSITRIELAQALNAMIGQ